MKRTLINASMLAIVLGLASGCVTTEQLAEVRAIAEGAQSTANSAVSAANEANSAAQAAADCCNGNSTKIDRMLEKVMSK